LAATLEGRSPSRVGVACCVPCATVVVRALAAEPTLARPATAPVSATPATPLFQFSLMVVSF
jgi:hypothetical protein